MNMSYCRFENTMNDLEDCVNAMSNSENIQEMDLRDSEKTSMDDMYDLCQKFIELYENLHDENS